MGSSSSTASPRAGQSAPWRALAAVLVLAALLAPRPAPAADEVTIQRDGQGVSISNRNTQSRPAVRAAPSANSRRILGVIRNVLADYSSKNHYSEFSEVKCKQMSEAVWYRLRAQGITVRLAGGNVEKQVMGQGFATYTNQANHAWVMAKVTDTDWLALEATNGSIVTPKDNPLYYSSAIFFRTPKEVFRFDELRKQAADLSKQVHDQVNAWNTQYAGRSYTVGSALEQRAQADKADLDKAKQELQTLLDRLENIFNASKELN